MKRNLLILLLLLLIPWINIMAQFYLASDSAVNYGTTWGNGSNYGSGFNAWSITCGASTGTFIGNPANDDMGTIGIGTTAFGLYATGTEYCNANRTFDALQWNDNFSFFWAINWDANNGNKGFDIKANGSIVFNVNNAGTQTISCTNGTIDEGYGTTPMFVEVIRTGESSYEFKMTKRSDLSATYTTTFTSANPVNEIGIYIGNQNNSDGERNIYFNHFEITNDGDFNVPSGSTTYSKSLSGSCSLIKSGDGTLILTGNNTYTDLTTISVGTLQFGDGVNISTYFNSNILNNSNLVFNTPENQDRELLYDISGTGTFTKTGLGKLSLKATNFYTGNTTVQQGELWLYKNLSTATITINSGAKLVIKETEVNFNGLDINNGGYLVVEYGKNLTIHRDITNNGNITIQNQSSGSSSGSLIILKNISGSGNFDYYLTVEAAPAWGEWNSGWHFLSSPVGSQAIIDFTTSGEGNGYDFYGYHEPTRQWINYKPGAGDNPTFADWNGPNFVVGRGYFVSYQQLQNNLKFSGSINNADLSISNLSYTPEFGKGWHLLGNPFPSALKWNDGKWALSGVAGTAKIWNSAAMSYTDIHENEIIPAAQGFFVQVNNSGNYIFFDKLSRTHSNTWYKSDSYQDIRLVARPADSSSSQTSIIRINPEATNGFDFYWDSRFLAGGAPKFYSLTDGEKISTNTLSGIIPGLEIPFGFESNGHTDYIIELAANEFNEVLVLSDLKTGITHDFSINPVYAFSSTEGDAPNRFLLKFSAVGIGDKHSLPSIKAWISNNTLYLNNDRGITFIEIFDLTGRKLQTHEISENGLCLVEIKQPFGVYLVKITNETNVHTIKAIIN
ncbi:MAG TPA: autotransporter-associated beta strand repeat-containing protein [Bacteroidales bacterium]|nr:autotransporter-associated beta strand repeat-containing protein [Bacteroidales bacterium]